MAYFADPEHALTTPESLFIPARYVMGRVNGNSYRPFLETTASARQAAACDCSQKLFPRETHARHETSCSKFVWTKRVCRIDQQDAIQASCKSKPVITEW